MLMFMQTDLSFFTAALLLLILYGQSASYDRHQLSHRLYRGMVFATLVILLLDTCGWSLENVVDPDLIRLNWATSTIGFLLAPLPALLWLLYAHNEVFSDDQRTYRFFRFAAIPAVPYALFSVLAPVHRLLFTVDDANRFHRGPLFGILVVMMIGYLAAAFLLLLRNRRRLDARVLRPLLFFMLPPLTGGVVQVLFYGTTLVWSGMTFSMLVLLLYLQHQSIRTDYLTGLYNRLQLDRYIRNRILAWKPGSVLGALMLDVDNFKAINDQFGHAQGDDALESLAHLLRRSFHDDDFIARYAGDEFVVVLDAHDSAEFDAIRNRLRDNLARFNQTSGKPYRLEASLGCALYDPALHASGDQYLHAIDLLMYEEKKSRKAGAAASMSECAI